MRILFLLFFLSSTACAQEIQTESCNDFKIKNAEFDSRVLESLDTDISDIKLGKLFYQESSGACVPTTDTYLVGIIDKSFPRIAVVLNGHTVRLDTISADDSVYLAAYYFSGGNQYVLSIFDVDAANLRPMEGPVLASNIRSIEIDGSRIIVQNQLTGEKGARTIVKREYRVENGIVVALE